MSRPAPSQQITETPIEESLLQMVSSDWVSQAIYVAAKLCIADFLAERPMKSAELAAATETHPASLYRLLRALASIGIFAEGEDARFTLTPLAAPLQKGKDSMRALIIHMGEKPSWQAESGLQLSLLGNRSSLWSS